MGGPVGAKGVAPINRRIGKRIKRERERQGFSQAALAQKAGTSAAHVTQIETGRRGLTLATLDKLARALRVPLANLFGDEPPLEPEPSQTKVYHRIMRKLREEDEDMLLGVERLIEAFQLVVASRLS